MRGLVNSTVDSVRSTLEDEDAIQNDKATNPAGSGHTRMLVINSETFTLWKDHYARLKEIVKGWEPEGKNILTLGESDLSLVPMFMPSLTSFYLAVGSKHTSFSDFPILPVFSSGTSRRIFDTIAWVSVAFLDKRLDDELKQTKTTKMEIEVIGVKKDGKPKRKLIGEPGAVIID